jgi:hypothetical protein
MVGPLNLLASNHLIIKKGVWLALITTERMKITILYLQKACLFFLVKRLYLKMILYH